MHLFFHTLSHVLNIGSFWEIPEQNMKLHTMYPIILCFKLESLIGIWYVHIHESESDLVSLTSTSTKHDHTGAI